MLDLVRKRHDGDGWLVFSEIGDKPGFANRWADALALGVWASNNYEAHLYEFKISREDLKRELRDPTKANAVGKYCTYWWLVVSDEKVLADLVIPDVWGILIPTVRGGSTILKVHRKGTKLKPAPFNPMFAVSLIRNIAKRYKSDADFNRMREERDAALAKRDLDPPPDHAAKDDRIRVLERELSDLRAGLEKFKDETGVDLTEPGLRSFQIGQIGREVKVAKGLHTRLVNGELGRQVHMMSAFAAQLEQHAKEIADGTVVLRELAGIKECEPNCRARNQWSNRAVDCSCGAQPLSKAEQKLVPSTTPPPDEEWHPDRVG